MTVFESLISTVKMLAESAVAKIRLALTADDILVAKRSGYAV
jgi:hypothetical protein